MEAVIAGPDVAGEALFALIGGVFASFRGVGSSLTGTGATPESSRATGSKPSAETAGAPPAVSIDERDAGGSATGGATGPELEEVARRNATAMRMPAARHAAATTASVLRAS